MHDFNLPPHFGLLNRDASRQYGLRPLQGDSDTTPAHAGHVAALVDQLTAAGATLQESVARLEARLAPVLFPGAAPNTAGGPEQQAPRVPRSPLTEALSETLERLRGLDRQVRSLHERLEV